MAIIKGELATCDRCGATHFCRELDDTHLDGGFTTVKNYEQLPDGWDNHYSDDIGLLCPSCEEDYRKTIRGFKFGYYSSSTPEEVT